MTENHLHCKNCGNIVYQDGICGNCGAAHSKNGSFLGHTFFVREEQLKSINKIIKQEFLKEPYVTFSYVHQARGEPIHIRSVSYTVKQQEEFVPNVGIARGVKSISGSIQALGIDQLEKPFDINCFAYNPTEQANMQLDLQGVVVSDHTKSEANVYIHSIINWRKIGRIGAACAYGQ